MATSGSTSRQSASRSSTATTGVSSAAVARLEERLLALAAELEARDERQREFAEEHRMLRERYAALTERYEGMAQAISVSAGLTAIGEGFDALAAELAPLRQLVPPSTTEPASKEVLAAIREIRLASQAPLWDSVSTLGVQTWDIPWIGAPKPPTREYPNGAGESSDVGSVPEPTNYPPSYDDVFDQGEQR